jgi:hypothetical protein
LQYGLPVLVLLVIFYPLFLVNFGYLDDFYLLWHNGKEETFAVWLSYGRFLTGLMMEKIISSLTTIDGLKYCRIISVAGWAVAICIYVKVALQWVRYNLIDSRLVLISAVYLACSLSVAIANGWGGTCFEMFITFTFGLLSGHLLYAQLKKHNKIQAVPIPMLLLVLLLGLLCLFTYQIGIGMFLIPFFLHFNNRKFEKPDRILITGVISMLMIVGLYFLLYKLQMGSGGPERATLELNIFKKISFFFGVPTAQAFSFNFLFNLRSIVSQAFYIAVIAVWVVNAFVMQRNKPVLNKIIYLAVSLVLLMLIYLPVMASVESFSSYRTMTALNLAAVLMLLNMGINWIKPGAWQNRFAIAAILIFTGVGYYNFHTNFLNPLVKEYTLVRANVEKQYTPGINKVYFLRPPEDLYKQQYHINAYRDEFGVPLTFKDWVPEPLVKQIIYEKTHDKEIAKKVEVVMFDNGQAEAFNKQAALKEEHTMAVDAAALFNSN